LNLPLPRICELLSLWKRGSQRILLLTGEVSREVPYVEGWNHNKIKVHEVWMKTGFTLDLDAKGFFAMRGSRHSITESGSENFLRVLGRDLYGGIQFGEFTCRELGEEMVYGC